MLLLEQTDLLYEQKPYLGKQISCQKFGILIILDERNFPQQCQDLFLCGSAAPEFYNIESPVT